MAWQISVLLCCFLTASGHAFGQSLIPSKLEVALTQWKLLSSAISPQALAFSGDAVLIEQDTEYPTYHYENNGVDFEFNACTGEAMVVLADLPRLLSEEEIAEQSKRWWNQEQIIARADKIKDTLFPASTFYRIDLLEQFGSVSSFENGKQISKIPDANIAKVFFKVVHGKIWGLSTLMVAIEKSSGQIQSIGLCRVPEDFSTISVSQDKNVTGGDRERIQIWDEWLQPYETTLSPDRKRPLEDPLQSMQNRSNLRLYLNTEPCGSRLQFPPRHEGKSVLIYANYFPSFLIDVTRAGDTITLSGQLPNKGHKAVLKLGSTEASVDGKAFTLSGAPEEVEGRLYLPYELLTQCNGVLTRWDEKKNTLWVDTRFLRRP